MSDTLNGTLMTPQEIAPLFGLTTFKAHHFKNFQIPIARSINSGLGQMRLAYAADVHAALNRIAADRAAAEARKAERELRRQERAARAEQSKEPPQWIARVEITPMEWVALQGKVDDLNAKMDRLLELWQVDKPEGA
jgi:hypothetical protein